MYAGVPTRDAGLRERRVVARRAQRLADAEVGDERVPVVQQDVLGLDVAVHHAVPVRVVERVGHLARDAHGVRDRELPSRDAGDRAATRPRTHGHHVVQEPAGLARVEQRQDVRVIEPRRESGSRAGIARARATAAELRIAAP